MKSELFFYGQLADITGCSSAEFSGSNVGELVNAACAQFPGLSECRFITTVGTQIVDESYPVSASHRVCLLPPFSGG